MASLIEAIDVKRKMFFEFESAPYHCMDVEVSRPTARGGQTLVRLKMRNLLTRAVFDRTFKAGDKFGEPDLEQVNATFLYSDADGYHFMDSASYETLTLVSRSGCRCSSRKARRSRSIPRRASSPDEREPGGGPET
jgi:elongation factor P